MRSHRGPRRPRVRAAVWLAVAAAGGVAASATAGMLEPEKPPRPELSSHGTSDLAQRGSYCWDQDAVGAVCAEYPYPLPTRRAVRVHPGSVVRVDLRHPASELIVRKREDGEYAPTCRADLSGDRWRFVVPQGEDRSRGVVLQATYDRGDAVFGIRLSLHRHQVEPALGQDVASCLPVTG